MEVADVAPGSQAVWQERLDLEAELGLARSSGAVEQLTTGHMAPTRSLRDGLATTP